MSSSSFVWEFTLRGSCLPNSHSLPASLLIKPSFISSSNASSQQIWQVQDGCDYLFPLATHSISQAPLEWKEAMWPSSVRQSIMESPLGSSWEGRNYRIRSCTSHLTTVKQQTTKLAEKTKRAWIHDGIVELRDHPEIACLQFLLLKKKISIHIV